MSTREGDWRISSMMHVIVTEAVAAPCIYHILLTTNDVPTYDVTGWKLYYSTNYSTKHL